MKRQQVAATTIGSATATTTASATASTTDSTIEEGAYWMD